MISDEDWERFQEKYGVDGYTDSIVFIKLDKLVELDSKIGAIEILLDLHYVEGDMSPKEAIDEVCHIIFPESRHSCSDTPIE